MSNTITLDLPISLDSTEYNYGEPGSCFLSAFNLAVELQAVKKPSFKKLRICHGIVTCTGITENVLGERIIHAWVEVTTKQHGIVICVDASHTERPVSILRSEWYYEGGEIKRKLVRRYTWQQARSLAVLLEHFGPWHKPQEKTICWTEADEARLSPEGLYVDRRAVGCDPSDTSDLDLA